MLVNEKWEKVQRRMALPYFVELGKGCEETAHSSCYADLELGSGGGK